MREVAGICIDNNNNIIEFIEFVLEVKHLLSSILPAIDAFMKIEVFRQRKLNRLLFRLKIREYIAVLCGIASTSF